MVRTMLDTSVYELHPAKIGVAWPLFADATFDRVHVASLFEGRQPGRSAARLETRSPPGLW